MFVCSVYTTHTLRHFLFSPNTALKSPPVIPFDSLPSAYYLPSSAAARTPLCSCCSWSKMPPTLRSATVPQGENRHGPGRTPGRYITPATAPATTSATTLQPPHHHLTMPPPPQVDITITDDVEEELLFRPTYPQSRVPADGALLYANGWNYIPQR